MWYHSARNIVVKHLWLFLIQNNKQLTVSLPSQAQTLVGGTWGFTMFFDAVNKISICGVAVISNVPLSPSLVFEIKWIKHLLLYCKDFMSIKITWSLGGTRFLVSRWKLVYLFAALTCEIFFQHWKRNCVSPCSHAICSIKHFLKHFSLRSLCNANQHALDQTSTSIHAINILFHP